MIAIDIKEKRKEIKKYIEVADEHIVKVVYAILEADAIDNWLDNMPENIKIDLKESIKQADNGQKISHDEVKRIHPQWFTK